MTTIADLVTNFAVADRPVGNLLDHPELLAAGIAAVKAYSGYGALATHLAIPIASPAPEPPAAYPEITEITDITVSEWAVIKPLFILYVERENALYLESSRGMGIDPFGRASSEVSGDITQYELDLPHKAFCRDIVTI